MNIDDESAIDPEDQVIEVTIARDGTFILLAGSTTVDGLNASLGAIEFPAASHYCG
jgi:hypothetical protein